MVKKVIEYEDFNGNMRKDTLWFNIGKGELMQWGTKQLDYLISLVRMIGEEESGAKVVEFLSEIIDMSYGVKSDDGSHFYKSPEILNDFKMTNAYSELYYELVSDADKAVAFIEGVIPKGIADIQNDPVYKARQENIEKAIQDGDIASVRNQILSGIQSPQAGSNISEVVKPITTQSEQNNLTVL